MQQIKTKKRIKALVFFSVTRMNGNPCGDLPPGVLVM
jgi:hypothetical protein